MKEDNKQGNTLDKVFTYSHSGRTLETHSTGSTGLSLNSTKVKDTLPQKMWLAVQRSWQSVNLLPVAVCSRQDVISKSRC